MNIFELLADFSQTSDLSFLVIGAHAVNAYGYSRETADLDLLICKDDRDKWFSWFSSIGYSLFRDGGNFLQLTPPTDRAWPIDLMLVAHSSFGPMMAESRLLEHEPTKPRIPSVEHLIALKLHALKQGRLHRFLKDFEDVVGIIECQKLDLCSEKMRQLFERYGTMDLYEKASRALGKD